MKYSYEGTSKSKIVEKYEKNDNKLIIYYLDGSKIEKEYSKELEEEVIKIMLDQALDFVIASDYSAKKKASVVTNWPGIPVIASTIFGHTDSKTTRYVLLTCIAWLIVEIATTASKLKKDAEEGGSRIEYIEKYRCFLEVQQSLRKYQNDACLLDGVDSCEPLSINTIDNFSFKEVKTVSQNIESCVKKEKLYMEIVSYIYKYISNPRIFENVIEPGIKVTSDNLDTIVEGLSLEKVKRLKRNISKVVGYDIGEIYK